MNSIQEVKVSFKGRVSPWSDIMLIGPLNSMNGTPPNSFECFAIGENGPGLYLATFNVPVSLLKTPALWRLIVNDRNNAMNSAETDVVLNPVVIHDQIILRPEEPPHSKPIAPVRARTEALNTFIEEIRDEVKVILEQVGEDIDQLEEYSTELNQAVKTLNTAVEHISGEIAAAKTKLAAVATPTIAPVPEPAPAAKTVPGATAVTAVPAASHPYPPVTKQTHPAAQVRPGTAQVGKGAQTKNRTHEQAKPAEHRGSGQQTLRNTDENLQPSAVVSMEETVLATEIEVQNT